MVSTTVVCILVLFLLAILAWVVLSFSQKRSSKSACSVRPGIVACHVVHLFMGNPVISSIEICLFSVFISCVVLSFLPINFLRPRHRLVYTVACAAQSSLWLNLLTYSFSVDSTGNKWISLLVKALMVVIFTFVIVMLTYPVLACVEAPIPLLGYSIGMVYSLLYVILRLSMIFSQMDGELANLDSSQKSLLIGTVVGQLLLETICMGAVILWYAYKFVKELRRIILCGSFWKMAVFEQPRSMNHIRYVKHLLSRDFVTSLKPSVVYTRIYLPLPLLIAGAVCAVIVFQLLIYTTIQFPNLSQQAAELVKQFKTTNTTTNTYNEYLDNVIDVLHSLTAIFVIAPVLSTIISVGLFIHFQHVVRHEIVLLRKGKSKFSNAMRMISNPSLKLTSSIRYCGFQIASIITGWMFYSIVFFSIGLFFICVRYLPDIFGYILYFAFIAVLLVVTALAVEGLMCKFAFLDRESNIYSTIVIDNRRAFDFFTYIVLLYNVATGLFTSTFRLLMSFLISMLLKPRLDKIVYIDPFQFLDSGHSMYQSFIIAEALLHNPIMNAFVQLLCTRKEYNQKPDYRYSRKARNRWHVAYTLLKNEELRKNNPDVEYTKNSTSVTYNAFYNSFDQYEPTMED